MLHHALADNMIRQTAKRLGADDILHALFDKFQDFRSEQPPFAHLGTETDKPLCQFVHMIKIRRRSKRTFLLYEPNNIVLARYEIIIDQLGKLRLESADIVQFGVHNAVEHAVHAKIEQTAHAHFRTLSGKEILKVVVAERRKLYENLADYADNGLFLIGQFYFVKIVHYACHVCLYLSAADLFVGKEPRTSRRPLVYDGISRAVF